MKRKLWLLSLVLMSVIFCGGSASAGPVLDEILKRGELVVGLTGEQPPLNVMAKDGKMIGLDADLAMAVSQGMNLKVRFSRMPFSDLLPALQAGKVDMIISGMTMTLARNSKVAFVGPYLVSGKGILLKRKTVDMLKQEGLNSDKFRVATLKGSTSQVIVEQAAPMAKSAFVESYDKAVEMLLQDQVDAVIADFPFCAYLAARYSEKELVVGETKLSFEPLGIAVREDPLLINLVDNFLNTLILSGEMKDMQEKWFKSRTWFAQLP